MPRRSWSSKKDGIPYVILRCAPLVDEMADATNVHVTGSVWLERGKTIEVSTGAALSAALARALDDGTLQGTTVTVPAETVDLAEAIRRASHVAAREWRSTWRRSVWGQPIERSPGGSGSPSLPLSRFTKDAQRGVVRSDQGGEPNGIAQLLRRARRRIERER